MRRLAAFFSRPEVFMVVSVVQIVWGIVEYVMDRDAMAVIQVLTGMIGLLTSFYDLVKSNSKQPKHINRTVKLIDDQTPPKFAEYLLHFLPKKDREPLLGDLEEEYREIYKKFGKRKAQVWYYCQVAMSFWPYIARAIRKLVGWGVVGWVGSAIRRLIG